ncbi:hypothetical protein MHY87_03535 [Microvirga sp. ACRRW]|uniref:hypothetical protein n=1 Tax=Microvirga sp. ACRRW TaxID=2918205 RepID=UPI001EF4AB78|nr:hypothetical protein [Microvirga sp. ACRRW]MCG7391973.1 hypothetical protein [Microvirga sp. ACRRW]
MIKSIIDNEIKENTSNHSANQTTRLYIDLVKAANRSLIRPIIGMESGYHLGFGRWIGQTILGDPETPPFVFERPNFDFGYHFDITHADWIGRDGYSRSLNQGHDLIRQRKFFLPQELCAYVFHCTEDGLDFERTYCALLHETEDGIKGSVFIRQEAPSGPFQSWLLDAASFHIGTDGAVTYTYRIPRPFLSDEVIQALKARNDKTIDDMIVATMLLASRSNAIEVSSKRSFKVDRYNSRRKLGQQKLDAPCIVKINRDLLVAEAARVNGPQGVGGAKRPHERRSHFRVIGRGTARQREVIVRASSINGGKPMQSYSVRA